MSLWIVALNNLVVLVFTARRSYREQGGYMGLLAANLVLAGWLLLSDNVMSAWSFVSIGAFVFMVVLPPFIDRAARRAVLAERMDLAVRLTALRELLQPGAKVGRIRKALEPMRRVRRGEAEKVLQEIGEDLEKRDGIERKALQIHFLSVLLYDRRWREAVEYFEDNLPPEVMAFHPPLASGMVRAYGETGDIEKMSAVMGLLEDSPGVSDSAASEILDQARIMFLAFCGRYGELDELLKPRSGFAQTTDQGTRYAWLGIGAKMNNKKEEARSLLNKALDKLKGRSVRKELTRHLEELDGFEAPSESLGLEIVVQQAEKVLDRAQLKASLPRVRGGNILKIAPVTVCLILVCVLVWIGMELIGEGSGDPATLILWGANMKEAVRGGQYYRLVSSVFLHAHWVHLALNMFVLVILGRMAEQILGRSLYVVVFIVAGAVGSAASFALGEAPLSVGSSGAIFGILGAMVTALGAGKGRWPDAWRKSLITIFLILGGLSLLPGLHMKVIDNWAHIGGLVGGAVLGGVAWKGNFSLKRRVSSFAAAAAVLLVFYAGVQVALDYGRELPWVSFRLGKVTFQLPATWISVEERAGYGEFHNIMSRERLILAERPQSGGTVGVQDGCRDVFSKEVRIARRQAKDVKALETTDSVDLKVDAGKDWLQKSFVYIVEKTELIHSIYVRGLGKQVDGCIVVHYFTLVSESGDTPRFLSRFLQSVSLADGK